MNSNLWSIIISNCVAPLVTIYIARKNIFSPIKLDVAKKQLYLVYLPLFKFIEPHLYKKADVHVIYEFSNLFDEIKQKHYELISANLINDMDILKNSITLDSYNYDAFDSVCILIDRQFERQRRLLNLPKRTLIYKINKNQFNLSTKNAFKFLFQIIVDTFPYFIMLAIFFFSAIIIKGVYTLICSLVSRL